MQREKLPLVSGNDLLVVTSGELHAQTGPTAKAKAIAHGRVAWDVPATARDKHFPTAAVVSPDGRFAVLLHSGFGATPRAKTILTVVEFWRRTKLRDFQTSA